MNTLLALLFSFMLLIGGGKTVENNPEERVLAYIEIVQIGDDIWARTSYDTRVFDSECAAKHVVAVNFLKTCVDSVDTKTKTKKL